VKPVATQPVEQNISQVSLPTISPIERVAAPPAPVKNVVVPLSVRPPSPPLGEEPPTTATSTEEATTTTEKKQYFGKPTAQIWIGNPPEDIRGMFPPPHREKIKDIRTAFGRGTNFPYAIVYFHSVEEASTAIEAINHSKLKFGEDYTDGPRGNYAGRGGGSFGQGSYDARKTGGSDTESGRGGFGRGGRGGRGGNTRGAGSTGSFSSRGTGSPARGGRGRGGGAPTSTGSKDFSASENDKSETPIWQNDDKPVSAAAVSGSEVSEAKSLATNPIPAPPQPAATSVSTAQSSTAGGESQSA